MDRIASVRIEGLRAIDKLELELDGLTVLIGENGTGKSTVLEALEILAKASKGGGFVRDWLAPHHGSFKDLLRIGSSEMTLGVRIEGDGPRLDYSFTLAPTKGGVWAEISGEHLVVFDDPAAVTALHAVDRQGRLCQVFDVTQGKVGLVEPNPEQLLLTWFGPGGTAAQPAIARVLRALAAIRVHVPFDLRPLWISPEEQRRSALRVPMPVEPALRLERLGLNLANCFHELSSRGREVMDRVLLDVRAGLGMDVVEVSTPSTARGFIDLAVRFKGLSLPVYSAGLSDGQLTYLAYVALRHLGEPGGSESQAEPTSVLAMDEPELHLNPALLTRALWFFEAMSRNHPVVLSTHADALLDVLPDAADVVRVLVLDERRAVTARRLSKDALSRWREKFSTLGEIRRAGLTHLVVEDPPPS